MNYKLIISLINHDKEIYYDNKEYIHEGIIKNNEIDIKLDINNDTCNDKYFPFQYEFKIFINDYFFDEIYFNPNDGNPYYTNSKKQTSGKLLQINNFHKKNYKRYDFDMFKSYIKLKYFFDNSKLKVQLYNLKIKYQFEYFKNKYNDIKAYNDEYEKQSNHIKNIFKNKNEMDAQMRYLKENL